VKGVHCLHPRAAVSAVVAKYLARVSAVSALVSDPSKSFADIVTGKTKKTSPSATSCNNIGDEEIFYSDESSESSDDDLDDDDDGDVNYEDDDGAKWVEVSRKEPPKKLPSVITFSPPMRSLPDGSRAVAQATPASCRVPTLAAPLKRVVDLSPSSSAGGLKLAPSTPAGGHDGDGLDRRPGVSSHLAITRWGRDSLAFKLFLHIRSAEERNKKETNTIFIELEKFC
jgi:hypothetical protein